MDLTSKSDLYLVPSVSLSDKASDKLSVLFTSLDLNTRQQAKLSSGRSSNAKLKFNVTLHEVRLNPEDKYSDVLPIEPHSNAEFEFIRFSPPEGDRKKAETIAKFSYVPADSKNYQTIYAEIEEDTILDPEDLSKRNLRLHDVDMSGRIPHSPEEQEHKLGLLEVFKHALDQLFYLNTVDEIKEINLASEKQVKKY
ncbi:MAG: hypothetical protein HRT47_08245 [Candidatus Caenarcaniphilales bacterium]|nr:hypothetical protein [Candidatus Caenarcaniphilales bacterium]